MDTTTALTQEQIEKAVNWWAAKLERPTFDNGDDSQAGGLTMMLAMMNAMSKPSLNGKTELFKEALKTRLEQVKDASWFSLRVDYSPQGELYEALVAAGIPVDTTTLSWKTNMWFRDGKVIVSEGYRAADKEL